MPGLYSCLFMFYVILQLEDQHLSYTEILGHGRNC